MKRILLAGICLTAFAAHADEFRPGLNLSNIQGFGSGVSLSLGMSTNTAGGIFTYGTTLPATMAPALSGDCTTSAGSFSLTCTKTSGTAFGALATQSSVNLGSQVTSTLGVGNGGTGTTTSTGTGSVVLSASSTLTGTITVASANFSGSVGIGNASPGYSLDVTGTGHFSSTLTLADGGTHGSAGINGSAIGGVTPAGGAFTTLTSTYSTNSALTFQVSNQNAGASASALIQGYTNAGAFYIQGTSTAGGASTYLNTTINGQFHISATGSLGQIIFSTGATPSTALTLAANQTAYFTGTVVIQGMASAATTSAVCFNTSNGLLTYDGTIGTCNTSSERFKHDIEPIRFDALEAVMRMQPVTFYYKENQNTPGKQLGFVAERLDEIDPLLVGRDAEGKANSIRFLGPMFAYVIGSEQQMQNEILELRQKVARLEAYLKH